MKDFLDYIVKNKYIIICVSVVVILYALGIVEFLSKVIILFGLILLAVWIGKKLQDNEEFIKDFFNFRKYTNFRDVYYYQKKDNENNKENK